MNQLEDIDIGSEFDQLFFQENELSLSTETLPPPPAPPKRKRGRPPKNTTQTENPSQQQPKQDRHPKRNPKKRSTSPSFQDVEFPTFTNEDFEHEISEMGDLKLEGQYLIEDKLTKNRRRQPFECECGKHFRKRQIFALHLQQSQHKPVIVLKEDKQPKTSTVRRKPQNRGYERFGNKLYFTKKIYFCGECLLSFQFNEQLSLHLQQNHEDIPDGTIYGLKQAYLFKFFQMEDKVLERMQSSIKYRCGCGKIYICSSSLRLHLSNVHNGEHPEGTIGAQEYWKHQKYIRKPSIQYQQT